MIRRVLAALVLTASFASHSVAAPAAPASPPILPGYWEHTSRVLSPISTKTVERRCVTAADVDTFVSGSRLGHYDCTYPTRVIAGGKIVLKGQCVERKKHDRFDIQGSGVYAPTHFSLTAQAQAKLLGIPIPFTASIDARRIGDVCPPGARKG